jgi:N4-gp56 family major capsid protein
MKDYILYTVNLALFDGEPVINTTTSEGLTDEMKTYYSDYLIDMAEPELVHDQFAQKHPIPKNGGKTIQFRKYAPLSSDINERLLTEGKTPGGQNLSMTVLEATVAQYGGYIELSDMLLLTAIDNNLVQATRLLGSQAGRVLDAITREEMANTTNEQFASGNVSGMAQLSSTNKEHYLTVAAVKRAVRTLKRYNAPKIDGSYIAIVHTDVAHDLMNDPEWRYPHEYNDTENIYEGEIGKVHGVRFVETSEGKVYDGAGASGSDVYATFVFGADAYGTTDISGGGLEHIVKQLGSAGSSDPLNQRATVGWKATKVSKLLVPEYIVEILTAATPV